MFRHNYINAQEVRNIKKYKYSSSDNSLTYKYFLSPLAEFVVDKFIFHQEPAGFLSLFCDAVNIYFIAIINNIVKCLNHHFRQGKKFFFQGCSRAFGGEFNRAVY